MAAEDSANLARRRLAGRRERTRRAAPASG